MINTIFAKECARIPTNIPGHPDWTIILYDIPIVPRVPLHVGQEVQIQVLSPADAEPVEGLAAHIDQQPTHTAHHSGIEGTVVEIRPIDGCNVEVVIRNESPWSNITHAYLAIQNIHGVTVQLSLWQRLLQMAAPNPIAKARNIPLETAMVIRRGDNRITGDNEHRQTPAVQREPVEPTHRRTVQLGRWGGRGMKEGVANGDENERAE